MRILDTEDRATPIARLDPRARALSTFAFALLIVLLETWAALSAVFLVTLIILWAARAANRATVRRLGELNLFALFLLAFMPFSMPGTPLFHLGAFAWSREGILLALRIALKANTVMLLCSALLGTLEPADLARALHRLGLPAKLAHALFFCVRYLEVLHVEYHRLRNAMKLRAFRPRCSRHALRSLGYLVGMLFVRSIDRSDRVLEAMKCRGFDGHLYSLAESSLRRHDAAFGISAVATATVIAFVEWGL